MRGFQPKKYADGGVVPFGSRGLNDLRNLIPQMEAMGYKQAQPSVQPQQEPRGVAGLKAIIPQMEAMGYKQQPQYFADGGRVRPRGFVSGKGTATSDSIPARLSNGEYVLPADTVRAVGVEALDALRESTHKPVKGERAHAARGFFAGGTPGGVGTRFQDQENARAKRAPGTVPGAPALGAYAPPAAAPSSAPVAAWFMPGTRAVFNESGKAIGDLAKQGRYGAAAGETARAALAYVPAVADDVIGGAVRAVGPGIVDAGRQFLGMNDGAAAAITNTTDARLAAGTRRAPSGFDPAIKPQVAAAPTVPQQAPVTAPVQRMAQQPQAPAFDFDNYQPEPGQGAFRNEQTGEVTRLQTVPSGTKIWKPQQQAPAAPAGFVPPSQRQVVRAPVLNPNGGVFSSMVDFTNQAGQAVQAIAANKGMRNDRKDALDQQRVGLDAASTFAKIEQGDRALGIDGRRADTAQDLAALQAEELGLKREAAGFQTRAAQRRESVYDNYSKAKTDEDRQAIAKQFPDLFGQGKDAVHRMEVVRGKTDPMTGQSSGDYVVVQDPKTGEVRQIQMGAAPAPQALPPKDQLKAGKTYLTPRGPARWDGNQFIPV